MNNRAYVVSTYIVNMYVEMVKKPLNVKVVLKRISNTSLQINVVSNGDLAIN